MKNPFVAQRFINTGLRVVGLLLTFFEDISKENWEVMGVETFEAFMSSEVTYSLMILELSGTLLEHVDETFATGRIVRVATLAGYDARVEASGRRAEVFLVDCPPCRLSP